MISYWPSYRSRVSCSGRRPSSELHIGPVTEMTSYLLNAYRQILEILYACTKGIWKVLSMVFYLSNRFTNLIMFGIILKSYLFSMLWHKFHEDMIMQTRKLLL